MIAFTAAEIADITHGRLVADPALLPTSIVTDSREASDGALYVAKPGEHADGHDFTAAAFERGAVLTLAERPVESPDGGTYPAVIVPDAVLAMGDLAREAVRRIRAERSAAGKDFTVIGITGSAGKTTTKDLLAGLFSAEGPTVAPRGSYNGEVGVPLTVLSANANTRYLVIEMGATGVGHIKYLAGIVRPDIGVVLGVGSAHSAEFGGVENIAKAKGELVEALSEDGTAILNLDDQRVAAMASRTRAKVLGFTAVEDAAGQETALQNSAVQNSAVQNSAVQETQTVRATAVDTNDAGNPVFELSVPDAAQPLPVRSQLIGAHHVANLLAAAAAAHAAGVPAERIATALSSQQAGSRWRMERTERADGVTIINDAYNANPESMRAALRTLADLGQGRRTWAVLGAMLELEDPIREHTAVGTQVVRLNISRLLVVGREARALYVSAVQEGSWGDECIFAETVDEAYDILSAELAPGDLVLFKSSNGVGLRHLGDRIALPPHAEATAHDGSALL